MTEERDSQLSAMFDGELPGAECELLARRLTKDDGLRSQWSRYSLIGAALRAERGVALHDRVAWRVQAAIAQEATYGEGSALDSTARNPVIVPAAGKSAGARWARFALPLAGASIAASVAAVSIFWLRGAQQPGELLATNVTSSAPVVEQVVEQPAVAPAGTTVALNAAPAARSPSNGEPDRYVTPQPSSASSIVPPARLANYVVAHSEYSGPLSRRMALLGILGAESGENVPAAPASDQDTTGQTDAP